MVADGFKHAPNLAIAAFNQRDLVPGIGGYFDNFHGGWSRSRTPALLSGDGNSGAEFRECFFFRSPRYFHHVRFRHMGSGLHEPMGKIAIIGKQQQSLAGIIQAPNGIDAAFDAANQVHHSGTFFGIAHRRDVALRFIQQ